MKIAVYQTRRNHRGQGMLEYLILSALIAILCIGAVKTLGSSIKTRIQNTSKRLTSEIPSDLTSFGARQ